MTLKPHDQSPPAATRIGRRTLLGFALAAGILGPMVSFGSGTARADSGIDSPGSEEYEIPDGIGSVPW